MVAAPSGVPIDATPAWVRDVDLPVTEPLSSAASGSVEYLLFDEQVRLNVGPPEQFRHLALRIANEQGLQDTSSVSMTYDPNYENIRIHSLQVYRNGQVIDHLKTAEFQVYQRESDLERQLYNGTLTVHTVLDDLRVGDVVEYSYSLTGNNPVFGNRFSSYSTLQWPVELARHYIRIISSPEQPLVLETTDGDMPFEVTRSPDSVEYSWDRSDVPALHADSQTPSWQDSFPGLYLTQFESWAEVHAWASDLFVIPTEQPQEIQALADAIRQQSSSPEQRLEAALSFVQRDIRYVGIELGTGSHRPSKPEVTLARRFGDCKDKTLLLNTLLGLLDIKANAVLVNTEFKQEILNFPATPLMFDHVITRAEIDGKVYWLDATDTHQRGELPYRTPVLAGAGLVLGDGEPQPVAISPVIPDTAKPAQYITQNIELPETNDQPAILRIRTELTGNEADYMRAQVAQSGEDFHREYLNYYEKLYPGIEPVNPTSYEDDPVKNRVVIQEHYRIPSPWERDDAAFTDTFWLDADLIKGFLYAPDVRSRREPYGVYHPIELHQTLVVQLDDNWYLPNEHQAVHNPAFDYRRNVDFDGKTLVVSHQYRSISDHVDAAGTQEFLADIDRVKDLEYYGLEKNLTTLPRESLTFATMAPWVGMFALFVFVALAFVDYVLDRRKDTRIEGGAYYSVPVGKFVFLNLATLGLYPIYWGYRNWSYIKERDGSHIWAWARALFIQFTLFGLYNDARLNLVAGRQLRLATGVVVTLSLGYFLSAGLAGRSESYLLIVVGLLLATLCLLPLQMYINGLEGNEERFRFTGRWRIRHWILGVSVIALSSLGMASNFYLVPPAHVIAGPDVPNRVIVFLKRQQLLAGDEQLLQFYSDAMLDYEADGSGLTTDGVFSYWEDESSRLQVEKVRFDDIADVNVTWGDPQNPTMVTVTRSDGSYFLLLLGTENGGDKGFTSVLNKRWLSADFGVPD